MHHLGKGNTNGARAQLGKALSKLEQYPDRFCQIENGKLVAALRSLLKDLEAGNKPLAPRVIRSDRPHLA